MKQSQIKSINENLASLREVAVELLNNPEPDVIQLAQYINDRCTDIELDLFVTERAELISLEYASAFEYYPEDKYQEIVDQQLIEVWVDSLSNHQVELALQFKQL